MTARTMRAIAASLLLIAAIFIYLDYFQSAKQEANEEEMNIPQIQLSSEEMMENLKKQGFVILEETEYDILLKAKEEAAKETGKPLATEDKKLVRHSYLIIKRGMSSSEVASLLEQAKIIENKDEFITYLREHKLTTSIRTGEFLLNSGMTFAEIVEEIS